MARPLDLADPPPPPAQGLNLKDLDRDALRAAFTAMGVKPYRGDQVFRWVWRRKAESIEAMTDLPKALRLRAALREAEAALAQVSNIWAAARC